MTERQQVLLGTFVTIRISGIDAAEADAAIDRGFAAIARVHGLMSFHEESSDVSRLNRLAWQEGVAVDRQTRAVLAKTLELSGATDGGFDICVGGTMAMRGLLPAPQGAPPPDPAASWRDIHLDEDGTVRFACPLWIDLGGIAKGYAVDAAIRAIAPAPHVQVVVNAGGDFAVAGPDAEMVELAMAMPGAAAMVEVENGALASSTGVAEWGATPGSHIDARSGQTCGAAQFVSVAAPDCMTADALTKVVLAQGNGAEGLLRRNGATAYLYDERRGWNTLGLQD